MAGEELEGNYALDSDVEPSSGGDSDSDSDGAVFSGDDENNKSTVAAPSTTTTNKRKRDDDDDDTNNTNNNDDELLTVTKHDDNDDADDIKTQKKQKVDQTAAPAAQDATAAKKAKLKLKRKAAKARKVARNKAETGVDRDQRLELMIDSGGQAQTFWRLADAAASANDLLLSPVESAGRAAVRFVTFPGADDATLHQLGNARLQQQVKHMLPTWRKDVCLVGACDCLLTVLLFLCFSRLL
jgi:hypothetical protein